MARLALAMLAMQFSIGALNDIIDAPIDARHKPRKPIPSGHASPRMAAAIAIVGATLGIGLSAVSGLATTLAALGCLGLGYAYDLRLSRTALSWLPLSVALPILPMHAWSGATEELPQALLPLVPVGVLGGAGLALANGLVDIDRDRSAGRMAAAVALGRRNAWLLHTLALGAAAALVVIFAPTVEPDAAGPGLEVLRIVRAWGILLGVGLLAAGAALLASGRAGIRERGWELEAVAVASLGLGWLAGTAAAGRGG